MAIFRCSISIISRGKGKSAVASSTYRAGEKIKNEYDGLTHDYTRKRGVVHTEILLPDNAPVKFADRAILWNAVEKIEKAKNSQLAREITISLPIELTQSQNINLVREYVKQNFVDKGMCADIAIHDTDGSNPHAHIMLTMRPLKPADSLTDFADEISDGKFNKIWDAKQRKEYILDSQGQKVYDPKKRQYKCKSIPTTDWNEQNKAEEWREAWADVQNMYLDKYHNSFQAELQNELLGGLHDGSQAKIVRVDHRSYERQGLEITPSIQLGVAAHQMEQKGIRTERGDINREIVASNKLLRLLDDEISTLHNQISHLHSQNDNLHEEISEVQGWLEKEKASTKPPTFADFITTILAHQPQAYINPQFAIQISDFLNSKQIEDYEGIERYLKNLMSEQRAISHKLTPIKQRLTEISNHHREIETYKKHKATYDKYKSDLAMQKPWKKKAFEREHGWVVGVYESAKENTDHLRNKDGKFPIGAWQKQHTRLSKDLRSLQGRYDALKAGVDDVNKIRTKIYEVLRKERQRECVQTVRSQGMER